MGLPASGKKDAVNWELLFRAALIIFILQGLAVKLYQSVNMWLNSDTVGMGMLSMEIWKHHNYLLTGYHVTAADTFFFTELPLQLIPQILTNYDPLALKLVTFGIFILGVAVLSAVIYLVSRQLNAALVFAALAANIPPAGYWAFAQPTTHNATIVFGGIILLLLLYINRIGKAEATPQPTARRKKAQAPQPAEMPWPYLACLAAVAFFTAFSDTIVLAWIVVPYVLAYLLVYREKTRASNVAIVSVVAVSALAYVIKMYLVADWLKRPLGINPLSQIIANLPMFFEAMGSFLLKGLSEAGNWPGIAGLAGLVSTLGLLAVLGYAGWTLVQRKGDRLLPAVLLASVAMMFGYFLLSDYVFDLGAARYITFTALAIVMLVALFYPENEKLFGGLVLALLVLSAAGNVIFVSTSNFTPNAQEHALIQYLVDNGQTHGYSTYENSNVITYLSGEKVTVRCVTFATNGIEPNRLLSCERWYQVTPSQGFLLLDNTTLNADSRFIIDTLTSGINASLTKNQNYLIYSYNLTEDQK
ncbi:hypothetical protein [Methanocella sp. MCL-LM]|uniref:hypothetical protein n=1 Tax=Methanocella sp. MCL-LM TaxID=3412035 RepID=UPI003C751BF7